MAFLFRCSDAKMTDRRGGHALTRRGRLAVDRRRGRRRGPRQRRPRRSMRPSRRQRQPPVACTAVVEAPRRTSSEASPRRVECDETPSRPSMAARTWTRRDVVADQGGDRRQRGPRERWGRPIENAGDEVVTARLGCARAAGVRRVVTEGLVDMGDTGGSGHAAGTPAATVMAPSRWPRPSLSLSKSGWSVECVRRRRNGRERGFRRADRRARSGFGGAGWQMTAWPVPRAPSTRWPSPRGATPH